MKRFLSPFLYCCVASLLAPAMPALVEGPCAPSLIVNGCFEDLAGPNQPAGWEFFSPPSEDRISVANRPSPAGDWVLRFANAGKPAVLEPIQLARSSIDFQWDRAAQQLRLEGMVFKEGGSSGVLPLVFVLELAGGGVSTASLAAPGIAGAGLGGEIIERAFDVVVSVSPGEWTSFEAWLGPAGAEDLGGPPAHVVGLRVASYSSGDGGEFFLDALQLNAEPVEFALLSPASADERGGYFVTLSGVEFAPGLRVVFGEAEAIDVRPSPLGVEAVAPASAPGWAQVCAMNADGGELCGGWIRVKPEMVVTSIEPPIGTSGAPVAVTLKGAGFVPGVRFEAGDQTGLANVIDTGELVIRLDGPAPGQEAIPLSLQAPWGARVDLGPYLLEEAPVVEALLPASGPTEGGNTVEIHGSGFEAGAVAFFDQLPAETTFLSAEMLTAIAPASPPFLAQIEIRNPSGVTGVFAGRYRYEGSFPGDFDSNGVVDGQDLLGVLDLLTGGEGALDLGADLDGDGRIGAEDAFLLLYQGRAVLALDEQSVISDTPDLIVLSDGVMVGGVAEAFLRLRVSNPDGSFTEAETLPGPGRIFWGDGRSTAVHETGLYSHVYERPGVFEPWVDLAGMSSIGLSEIVVDAAEECVVREAQMTLLDGPGAGGRLAVVSGAANETPAAIEFTAVVEGRGALDVVFLYDGPAGYGIELAEFHFVSSDVEGGVFTGTLPLDLTERGLWPPPPSTSVRIRAQIIEPGPFQVTHPVLPVTLYRIGFVTPDDCEEARRAYEEASARKAAKKNDCDELRRQLEELLKEKQDCDAAVEAAEQDLADAEQELADMQAEFDSLSSSINSFLSGYGASLHTYTSLGDITSGSSFVGAKAAGADSGVGIAFDSVDGMLNAGRAYRAHHGHSIGHDLNRLRKLLKEMPEKEAEIAAKKSELDALKDKCAELAARIADLQALLDECMRECAEIDQEIADLAEHERECLEQLERQREARGAIDDAAGEGADVKDEADSFDDEASEADDFINGRSGTPEEKGDDLGRVGAARKCKEEVDDLIGQGDAKVAEAEDALGQGDTAGAEQAANEARALYDQARAKLRECRETLARARANAARRPERECNEGDVQPGDTYYQCVWTGVSSIEVTPGELTPEEWARQRETAKGITDSFKKLMALIGLLQEVQEATGVELPVGGTVTPDAADIAEKIVEAYFDIMEEHFHSTVWITLTGHRAWNRTDKVCVNGEWTNVYFSGADLDDTKEERRSFLVYGSDKKEQIAKQLRRVLQEVAQPKAENWP